MDSIINFLNTVFWSYILLYGLLAVGLYFTIRLGFIQFLHFREMIRCVTGSGEATKNGITPLQALTVSLASRVGTGNMAGVAVALYLGGPGAIFWMWIVALVGMATAYAESLLAQLYKVRGPHGMYRGGPAVYITNGLGARWAGIVFAICLLISFGLVFNAVQANAIAGAMKGAFAVPELVSGIGIAALAGIVIFGGVRKIARVAEIVVPFMAGIYLLLALAILVMNIGQVPAVLSNILANAFGLDEAVGGVTGGVMAAMMNGVKRGLFSNEAGMGSAPNIAAVAVPEPHHPASQGFVQALGVFIDTLVICTCTAIIILLSGILVHENGVTGMALTQDALEEHVGWFGAYFIAVAIFFFAFTSIIGNYSYAENAVVFLGLRRGPGLTIMRCAVLAMVVWGSLQSVATVFNAADASMGLMASINLVAIVLLSGQVVRLTRDYIEQRKAGSVPKFHIARHEGLGDGIDPEIWK
ncbi:AGCS family alanine or glycine:cation symporter [Aliiruegeria haliotis]|uniref:AGCS family alanine or glycine:cation symporter n=1 Tax=Aliiruegeria haliotis TaxID=1280846 RepID=A0A2T0RZ52_9RHOB|nr:sodium:alanine symporter family protein [Aliiruegeria haliotis]PRY26447.1 AGCS family alanine or glycine:cation symporter [Aliiruegeria haliotis]